MSDGLQETVCLADEYSTTVTLNSGAHQRL